MPTAACRPHRRDKSNNASLLRKPIDFSTSRRLHSGRRCVNPLLTQPSNTAASARSAGIPARTGYATVMLFFLRSCGFICSAERYFPVTGPRTGVVVTVKYRCPAHLGCGYHQNGINSRHSMRHGKRLSAPECFTGGLSSINGVINLRQHVANHHADAMKTVAAETALRLHPAS